MQAHEFQKYGEYAENFVIANSRLRSIMENKKRKFYTVLEVCFIFDFDDF
jgi:hypothetical protein